jgi:hypothetical protein
MALSLPLWYIFRGIYIKDKVIVVQNKKVKAKMQLARPLRPYDATEGLTAKFLKYIAHVHA